MPIKSSLVTVKLVPHSMKKMKANFKLGQRSRQVHIKSQHRGH